MREKMAYTIGMIKGKCKPAWIRSKKMASSYLSLAADKLSRLSGKQRLLAGGGMAGIVAVIAIAFFLNTAGGGGSPAVTAQAQPGETGTPWVIKIGGSEVVTVASEEDAWAVFEGLKAYYQTDGAQVLEIGFSDEIKLEELETADMGDGEETNGARIADIPKMTTEDAIAYIVTGSREPITYVVQGGDTLWDIAVANGINTDELLAMNPGFTPESMQIGQTINLYMVKPFVTVQTTEMITATEKIPYDVIYESTNSLYKGQTSVKEPGEYGSKSVQSQIIKQNGIVVASTVLDEQVIAEPKTQLTLKGTQTIPTHTGSGYLSSPVSSIEISSGYGASRGSRRHLGIDLRNPYGTPFYASDAGSVTFVGYSGSYGNLIVVNHGNGIVTKYAHCSKMYVTIGEAVSKGQTLGTVGSTGNATGNVLHYEVIVNGVNQNPANYL